MIYATNLRSCSDPSERKPDEKSATGLPSPYGLLDPFSHGPDWNICQKKQLILVLTMTASLCYWALSKRELCGRGSRLVPGAARADRETAFYAGSCLIIRKSIKAA